MEEHRTPVRVLQPELVGVMRLFAIFQVFKSLVLAILVFLHGEPVMSVIFLPLVTSIGFLVYVYLDFLRAETGRWYLIVTVTLFTIDTLMTKSTFWLRDVFAEHLLRADSSDYSLQLLIGGFTSGIALVWNPFFHMSMLISLLMLLIVLSWQYDFRYSLGFTLVTSVFDFILNVLLVTDDAASIASSLTIILGRTFIFILVLFEITISIGFTILFFKIYLCESLLKLYFIFIVLLKHYCAVFIHDVFLIHYGDLFCHYGVIMVFFSSIMVLRGIIHQLTAHYLAVLP